MNVKKFHLALATVFGFVTLVTLFVTRPWGLLMAICFGISVAVTVIVGSLHDPFDIRIYVAVVMGLVAMLFAALVPFEWVKVVVWLVFTAEQVYLTLRILASRPYRIEENLFSLFVAVFFGTFICWLITLKATQVNAQWIGVIVGIYVCVTAFRFMRTLGPKTHTRQRYQKIAIKH